ncbi:MAG: oligosaccharide flippase family protein [Saprospiraceae bacterium]|nr:oligosaccharide flippase family protein [Saprospiraceae bacterium]MCF8250836.1 oligosaccharide flippase family protein [Saprospiraceae bacterium]MCF8281653.1 oligosaccharide flippase family protein [Bacteroidales bacterium]MCF8312637.1 oligosaccharide flippase family protein [Saprospiraceae bacterium]MCF8441027.1 oligosaccharide flippase family protein [Saprospiraceae bacterium]
MIFIAKIKTFLGRGHERTVRAKKNVILSVVYKGIGMLTGFLYFPLSLEYLGVAKFGLFLTLVSVLDWFAELDIGITNGLRNKLGAAIAEGDDEKARGYVSTACFALGSIFSGIAVIFVAVCFVLPWSDWLQAEPQLNQEIAILAALMFGALAINMVSAIIFQVFYALQRMAMVDFYNLLSKVLFLLVIVGLIYFTEDSLVLFGTAKALTFALVPLSVGIYYFRGELWRFRPSYRLVKMSLFQDLFSLGVQFFVIRLSMIVIHQTNNLLIAHFVSLDEVPKYEAAYKYLSIFLLLFIILTNQLWAATVEAYQKGDIEWVKNTLRSTMKIWVGTLVLSLLMIAVAPLVFDFWLQGKLKIEVAMTVSVAVSIAITTWVNMFNLVLNGTGKIRLQMYGWIFAGLMNIPISIFFANTLGMGSVGIVLGTVVSLVPTAILSPLQVRKILSGADRGLWAR